ncbi:hypothetical protein DFJ74DRAFT_672834 [Hyaloraphidium curvatum]|nr:hypothetical protein DFJ74DRAFT_672834 [Hyaloraphidium curvatum]
MAIPVLLLLALVASPAVAGRPSWRADVSLAALGGPRPVPGSSALWRQCSSVSLANRAAIAGRWAGTLRLEGGSLASSSGAAQLVRLHGTKDTYEVEPAEGRNASVDANASLDLLSFCVDYRNGWAAKPDISIEPIEEGYVEVAPDGDAASAVGVQAPYKKLVRRQDMFVQDWSSGSCRCLNALAAALPSPTTSRAGPTSTPPPPPPPPSGGGGTPASEAAVLDSVSAQAAFSADRTAELGDRDTALLSGRTELGAGAVVCFVLRTEKAETWYGTAVASEKGAFSFLTGALPEGDSEVVVVTEKGKSEGYKLSVKAAPDPRKRLPALVSVSGRQVEGAKEGVVVPPGAVLVGTGPLGSKVEVQVDGKPVGVVSLDRDGGFVFDDPEAFAREGEYKVTLIADTGESEGYRVVVKEAELEKAIPPYLLSVSGYAAVAGVSPVSEDKVEVEGVAESRGGSAGRVVVYRVPAPGKAPEEWGAAATEEKTGRFRLAVDTSGEAVGYLFRGEGGTGAHHFVRRAE